MLGVANGSCSAFEGALRGLIYAKLAQEVSHFYGPGGRFGSFVTCFRAGALNGLLNGVHREYAKQYRHARIKNHLLDSAGHTSRYIVEVRRCAPHNGSETYHRGVLPGFGHRFGDDGNLKSTRAPSHVYGFFGHAMLSQRRPCAIEKPLRNHLVEPAGNNCKTCIRRSNERPFKYGHGGVSSGRASYGRCWAKGSEAKGEGKRVRGKGERV